MRAVTTLPPAAAGPLGGLVRALDPDVRSPRGVVALDEAGDVAAAQRADEVLAAGSACQPNSSV